MGNDLFRKYMKSKYAQSLKRSGAEVKWIELEDISAAVAQACLCDGLLLPGGADIAPSLYGQEKSEKCGTPNITRDSAEPVILDAFLKSGKPVFAICRGFQLLNVHLGGTLIQDIPKNGKFRKHMDFFTRADSIHRINICENSVLYDILGASTADVNSMHHQAIDKTGANLTVTASSPDGIIEATELNNYPFCLGVQWHPEHMSKKNSNQQKLFDRFVAECKK